MDVFAVHAFDQPAEELTESDIEGLRFLYGDPPIATQTSALRSGRCPR
jgi:hypothetical protein